MKDTNIYTVELKFEAAFNHISMGIRKNGVNVDFDRLPQAEKEKIATLVATGYLNLDKKLNNKQENNK